MRGFVNFHIDHHIIVIDKKKQLKSLQDYRLTLFVTNSLSTRLLSVVPTFTQANL